MNYIEKVLDEVKAKNASEPEFLQAVNEVLNTIKPVIEKHNIKDVYLFGSYAKGYATETSDVDLCISTSLTGLNFVALSEDIREELNKKIDLIRFSNLENNLELIGEIMKDGIKIYG